MRHLHDVMNAEEWNPDLKKGSHKNDEKENTIVQHACDNISSEVDAPSSTISKKLNSIMKAHSTDDSQHETPALEGIENIQSSSGQPAGKTTPLSEKGEVYFTQPKPSSVDTAKTKKRIRKNSRLWMLLSGLIISLVSGTAIFLWLSNSDSKSDMASQALQIEESEAPYNGDTDTV